MLTRGEAYELSTIRSRNFCMILWHGRREDGDEKKMDVNHRLNILVFMYFASDMFPMEMFHLVFHRFW